MKISKVNALRSSHIQGTPISLMLYFSRVYFLGLSLHYKYTFFEMLGSPKNRVPRHCSSYKHFWINGFCKAINSRHLGLYKLQSKQFIACAFIRSFIHKFMTCFMCLKIMCIAQCMLQTQTFHIISINILQYKISQMITWMLFLLSLYGILRIFPLVCIHIDMLAQAMLVNQLAQHSYTENLWVHRRHICHGICFKNQGK